MANPTNNVIATVTIQDQDLLTAGLPNLVNRSQATVTLAMPSAANQGTSIAAYSGYTVVTNTVPINIFSGPITQMLYVRNANPAGSSSQLQIGFTPQNQAATVIVLVTGAVFLFAAPAFSSPNGGLVAATYAVGAGQSVIMEYFYAV